MPPRRGPHRRFFDIWSRVYDAPPVQRLTYRPEHDAVLRGLRQREARRILDIGCGTGLLAERIRSELPESQVVGCDFSRGMLSQAQEHERADALVQGSALALPFADGRFDAIVSTEAFHWFPDQRQALAEFLRVLTPKGRLLVSLVNPPLESMSRAGRRISRLAGEPANWPTKARMRAMAEDAGFQVEAQRLVLRFPATFVLPSILTIASKPG